jgi:flagellar hook-basal body complex protein FliE
MPELIPITTKDITLESGLKSLSRGLEKSSPLKEKGPSFTEILKKSVLNVDELQKEADLQVGELVSGNQKNIHESMISLEKADISFKMMVKVRNKILEAYKEIMRMNV